MVWKTPQIGGAILGTVLACGRRRRQPTVDSGPSVVFRVGPEVAVDLERFGADAWPRRAWTVLTDSPAWISADA